MFLSNLLPTLKSRRAVLVVARASLPGVSCLPQRFGPAASTWMTDIDFLAHFYEFVLRVLHSRTCPRSVDPVGGVDERAQRTFFTHSKCQFGPPLPGQPRSGRYLVELGTHHGCQHCYPHGWNFGCARYRHATCARPYITTTLFLSHLISILSLPHSSPLLLIFLASRCLTASQSHSVPVCHSTRKHQSRKPKQRTTTNESLIFTSRYSVA